MLDKTQKNDPTDFMQRHSWENSFMSEKLLFRPDKKFLLHEKNSKFQSARHKVFIALYWFEAHDLNKKKIMGIVFSLKVPDKDERNLIKMYM